MATANQASPPVTIKPLKAEQPMSEEEMDLLMEEAAQAEAAGC
jgi:hypothetical protein